jgi:hypothetical protein
MGEFDVGARERQIQKSHCRCRLVCRTGSHTRGDLNVPPDTLVGYWHKYHHVRCHQR